MHQAIDAAASRFVISLVVVKFLLVMNQPEVTRIAARILLLAGLVGINAIPFFITNTATSVETIFMALSAIHAELCLFMAWSIFSEKRRRYSRMLWSLLGTTAAVIAATQLLPGSWTSLRPWPSALIGIGATLPAMLPMAAVFATQRYCAETEFVFDTQMGRNLASFRLRQLFVLIACCAFLSLLLRRLIKSPGGWLASLDQPEIVELFLKQSFVMGLLAAPCALTILKPNRFCFVWLAYFVAVAAFEPILDQIFIGLFGLKVTPALGSLAWSESYPSVVIDNITWYGPQLLPTVVLFVVFRLTGVRIQDTK